MSTRVSMAEIAELAGVSVPTVSKVLNGREGVASDTRDHVRQLLEEHHYMRRGTSSKRPTGLIDFVIRDLDPNWAMPLVQGAEDEAARAGVSLVVTSTHGRRIGNRHWVQHLATRRTDAVVLTVTEFQEGIAEELSKLNTPVVLVDPLGGTAPDVPAVAATNYEGGFAATQHLLQLGHQRIGIITGPTQVSCSRERLQGYRAALSKAGVPTDPRLEHWGDFLPESGESATRRMLSIPQPPTAIFAGSDQCAAGVYKEAKRHGLVIPDDLSVVGFDDVMIAKWLQPELTTIRQPLEEMAREAIRMAMQLVHGNRIAHPRQRLATQLVMRESTGRPKLT
ncbi:LacI family DNA-binding transcriptional regulator [Demequina aurantiaca]|uniref:LacI family DNA-binding transcriptional regulator n=1 Tax=Demequina aurantiaca TaxID=676200 RepID=UPI0007827702|nr:LacI family DNA-binding transcriptional regulator [Demequina aurantiaca]